MTDLPKWAEEAAKKHAYDQHKPQEDEVLQQYAYLVSRDDFLAGVRLVLDRLRATGSWDEKNPYYDPNNAYYNGRESVRREVLGDLE
jgi:hypothetical protein